MAGSDLTLLEMTYAYDSDRSEVSSDDLDVTDWDTTAKFIVCLSLGTAKDISGENISLRWRDVTDSGSFAAVTGTGEIKYAATSAVLSNGNAVAVGERLTDATGSGSYTDGVERVNANQISQTLLKNNYTEHQFAIDPADAQAGHEYEFEIYSDGAGASIGTLAGTITMYVEPPSGGDRDGMGRGVGRGVGRGMR